MCFSQRWYSHRYNCKNMTTSEANDQARLELHYMKKYPTPTTNFKKAFSIIIVDTTNDQTKLDFF